MAPLLAQPFGSVGGCFSSLETPSCLGLDPERTLETVSPTSSSLSFAIWGLCLLIFVLAEREGEFGERGGPRAEGEVKKLGRGC